MTGAKKAGVRGAKEAARAKKEIAKEAAREAGRTGGPVDLESAAERVQGELAGKEPDGKTEAGLSLLRRHVDGVSLQTLEMCIRRDLEDSRKIDKAGAFVGVRIGLELQAAKALVQHGLFEEWVERSFEGLTARRAQYHLKIAKVFLTETSGRLQLPQATEMGALMVRSSDGSDLHKAVMDFVGEKTLPELMDHYGIRAKGTTPGGFRPSAYMVAKYQGEHPELAGIPFEQWPAAAQEDFRKWQQNQVKVDDNSANRVAAEGMWANIRSTLADHGLKRKSFAYLTKQQLEETQSVLALVSKELGKALKAK